MFLKKFEIKNIRSISSYKNEFLKGINLIYGKNGVGKTTILEAIHTLSISKSFRSGYQKSFQKTNTDSMSILGHISGEKENSIAYRKMAQSYKIKINEVEIDKISDLIGVFPSIVLSPEDIDIVSGGNSARLMYINKILSISSKNYLETLTRYNKIVKRRNRCLINHNPYDEIIVWDEQLSPLASKIWEYRENFFTQFNEIFKLLWEKVVPSQVARIQYQSPKTEDKNNLIVDLRHRFEKDKLRGQTGAGPHKDKINFFFGDIDTKNQASQGEKKIFLAVLKIAEAKYLHQKTRKKPVLLLDDLFAKLDRSRGKKILQLIDSQYQTFITTTDNSVESYFDDFEEVNFIKLEENRDLCSVA
ncbi:MAG: DNA replication and repair protein RecF [Candidatus Marinimicrobia bacterium]|nr:DNA replication and repair protein RecF [Candidatus Neomarinimicrobiota bacterium]